MDEAITRQLGDAKDEFKQIFKSDKHFNEELRREIEGMVEIVNNSLVTVDNMLASNFLYELGSP